MPAAIVIELQARTAGVIHGATGQYAHGYWDNSWREIDREFGSALHDERPIRQFTVSPLFGLRQPEQGRTAVARGDTARLRITVLDELAQANLLGRWLPHKPDEISIGGISWAVRKIALAPDDDRDARQASYADLYNRYRQNNTVPKRWDILFKTPLAFHIDPDRQEGAKGGRRDYFLFFPLPEKLVDSWINHWTQNAPIELPRLDYAQLRSTLLVSRYELKTEALRYRYREQGMQDKVGVTQIGCVGRLRLDGARLPAVVRQTVATLVDFSFYCGTGHHTTMGMGQTRIIAVN